MSRPFLWSTSTRRIGFAVMAVALVAFIPNAPAQSGGNDPFTVPPNVEWWGPTDPRDGHHIRIPVTVSNPSDSGYTMETPAVRLELDVSQVLADAGWPAIQRGNRPALSSFEFDLDSVRVVAMTNFLAPAKGTFDGRLRVVDPENSGDSRFLVPSRTMQGHLGGEPGAGFDAKTNPAITVFWHADKDIAPGDELHYMVYLETLTHGDHAPAQKDPLPEAALNTLYGPGPSRELYGHMPIIGGTSGWVSVNAYLPDTHVTLLARTGNEPFRPVQSTAGQPNPITVHPGGVNQLLVARNQPVDFKLESDKPILGYSYHRGFVPGASGTFADTEFRFWAGTNNFVYFINSGDNEPTTLRVKDAQGTDFIVHLSQNAGTGKNPYSYSRSCGPAGLGMFSVQATGIHTVVVEEGGPVLVQVQDRIVADNLVQVPDVWGNPTGSSFQANIVPSNGGGTCTSNGDPREWFATALNSGTGLVLSNPDDGKVLIPNNPNVAAQPVATMPDVEEFRLSFQEQSARGHPLSVTTTGEPIRLFVGGSREAVQATSNADISTLTLPVGPMQGDAMSTSFFVPSSAVVVNPFPENTVQVEFLHFGGVRRETFEMGPDGSLLLEGDESLGELRSVMIESSKPVFVYPTVTQPSYLAGIPSFADIDVGGAQYRGHLISLAVPGGIEPVVQSATPGQAATYTLTVQNRGRLADGSIQSDSVNVEVDLTAPDGWEVDWSPKSLPLFDNSPRSIEVSVEPAKGAVPGQIGAATVKVVSKGNPNIEADAELITRIKSSFAVGIWFDIAGKGQKFQPQPVVPGEVASYDIVVQNLGTVKDTLIVGIETPPTGGWQAQLVDQHGNDVDRLTMVADEIRHLQLLMTPPDKDEDIIDTIVKVTSQSKPAAFSSVTAQTKLRQPTEISLTVDHLTELVLPGGEAVFPLTISNIGKSGTEVEFDLLTVAGDDWMDPILFVINPATGARTVLGDELSIGAGQSVELFVALEVPVGAGAEELADIRFGMTKAGSTDEQEAFFAVVVDNLHVISAAVPSLPRTVNSLPSNHTLDMFLANGGNLDELIEMKIHQAPPGWQVFLPQAPVFIQQEDEREAQLAVMVPAGTRAGDYQVIVALRSEDGNTTQVPLAFDVEEITAIRIAAPATPIEVQPGESRGIGVIVTNTGNTPVRVTAAAGAGDSWAESMDTSLQLQPLEQGTLMTEWVVPANVRNGATTHQVSAYAQNLASASGSAKQESTITFAVDRPDLRVLSAELREAPGGTIVEALIENQGGRTGRGVGVTLFAGDKVLDEIIVEELSAGRVAPVSLLAPIEAGGPYRVVVDPADVISEEDENNNILDVHDEDEEHGAPAPSALLVLAGLVSFCVLVRRRNFQ